VAALGAATALSLTAAAHADILVGNSAGQVVSIDQTNLAVTLGSTAVSGSVVRVTGLPSQNVFAATATGGLATFNAALTSTLGTDSIANTINDAAVLANGRVVLAGNGGNVYTRDPLNYANAPSGNNGYGPGDLTRITVTPDGRPLFIRPSDGGIILTNADLSFNAFQGESSAAGSLLTDVAATQDGLITVVRQDSGVVVYNRPAGGGGGFVAFRGAGIGSLSSVVTAATGLTFVASSTGSVAVLQTPTLAATGQNAVLTTLSGFGSIVDMVALPNGDVALGNSAGTVSVVRYNAGANALTTVGSRSGFGSITALGVGSAAAAVPEPGTAALLALGVTAVVGLVARRRRTA
jgi:hypothetical protein